MMQLFSSFTCEKTFPAHLVAGEGLLRTVPTSGRLMKLVALSLPVICSACSADSKTPDASGSSAAASSSSSGSSDSAASGGASAQAPTVAAPAAAGTTDGSGELTAENMCAKLSDKNISCITDAGQKTKATANRDKTIAQCQTNYGKESAQCQAAQLARNGCLLKASCEESNKGTSCQEQAAAVSTACPAAGAPGG